ncbi:hypothetical protein JG687_00012722 [Phytophthora cactorum]|uniref:Uncharacterized protein n=1 Tax=Phytophthora cactorum TaxID=29920 RepID=A0A8T1U3G7_9STRA|nr:hypothetical protein JG687_00012722 [Phytophthora cactorum]
MPGLSASELHPACLYAGDTVEYYSRAFVAGDPQGYRLIPGQCAVPTRSSAFSQAVPAAIRSATEATMREHHRRCEDIVPERSQSEEDRDELVVAADVNTETSNNTTLCRTTTRSTLLYQIQVRRARVYI